LVFGAGIGLIGAGAFITDPVAGFPPSATDDDGAHPTATTRHGALHNLSATPIFIGIPACALVSAASSARRKRHRWAAYSAGSALAMACSTVLFGKAFAGDPRLAGRAGAWQRASITTGFAWLSALSLQAATHSRHAPPSA
jgi:hypothetical protein